MNAILGPDGRPYVAKAAPRKRVRASYDSAATTRNNERHWGNADSLSGSDAASPEVRRKIRERARYEAQESNSYAKGMVLTLANDTIGTGPRLQLMIPGPEVDGRREGARADASRSIEREFMLWSYEVRLAEKLRTMRMAKAVDGEAFAAFVTNPALRTRVQLDLELIECDRVTSPWMLLDDRYEADGIRYDAAGNPVAYAVAREEFGTSYARGFGEYDTVAAEDMVHLFRRDRAGQRRGISELAAGLQVFADLRRFALATIRAAEHAASYSGILYTEDGDPNDPSADDEYGDATPGEAVEVEHNSLLVVNNGRKLAQLKAEHPGTTYEMFHREKLREAARCLNMPYNVAAGDSSRYNYASGRLDHQTYDRSLKIEQDYFGAACLDRVFLRWLEEAMLIPGYLPEGLPPFAEWNWLWFFDARPHVDPLKEASAAGLALETGQTTEAEIGAKDGVDWEDRQRQRAKELGISLADYRRLKVLKQFGGQNALVEAVAAVLRLDLQDEQASERETADAA